MANCGLVLNDGTSFFELNTGGFLLLNDNTCAVEPGAEVSKGGWLPTLEELRRIQRENARISAERDRKRRSEKDGLYASIRRTQQALEAEQFIAPGLPEDHQFPEESPFQSSGFDILMQMQIAAHQARARALEEDDIEVLLLTS